MDHYSIIQALIVLGALSYILWISRKVSSLKARLSASLDSSEALSRRLEVVRTSRDSRLQQLEQEAAAHATVATETQRQKDELTAQLLELTTKYENNLIKLREKEDVISRLQVDISRLNQEMSNQEDKSLDLEQRLKLLTEQSRNINVHPQARPSPRKEQESAGLLVPRQEAFPKRNQINDVDSFARANEPDYVIFDIETTGFSSNDEIVEIALIHVTSQWIEVGRIETTVRASRASGPQALEKHGLTTEMLAKSPCFSDVSHGLANFCDGKILVSHNLGFDRRFLDCSFNQVSSLKVDLGVGIDTLSGLDRSLPCRLEDLCKKHGVTINRSHSAMGDAEALLKLLKGGFLSLRISGDESPVQAKGLTRPGDCELLPRSLIRKLPDELESRDASRLGDKASWLSKAPKGFRMGPKINLKESDKVCCSCRDRKSGLRDALYEKHQRLGLLSARSISADHICIVVEDFSSDADKVKDAFSRRIPFVSAQDFLSYKPGSLLQAWLPATAATN